MEFDIEKTTKEERYIAVRKAGGSREEAAAAALPAVNAESERFRWWVEHAEQENRVIASALGGAKPKRARGRPRKKAVEDGDDLQPDVSVQRSADAD